ncbi:PREDICTED: flap endonuclease GEN-like 1 isoform X2 [Populus euphratica]|uniref:Flap endonuclease GEN-like 1 n=1 Tax=Populus euphratica TaxID=75702 RepID=A0AAJ6XY99_POPEU|nr:PREDICTED: flap endonuclease GEN-like 1 isoform X2 [Populus euphratica]
MGVGGKFWDLLKPYARHEGPDFLREKRVAVDLSYWIVQHETAIKATRVRKPHLRLTFFRTINLFSKFGALPVFVVDGTPSPLKSKARIARFFRFSGVDVSGLPVAEGVSAERNKTFLKCVQECVELLELFGMPVLKANGEAEALCAQLNAKGHVDACITADSDAFLFGAKCVIKCIKPNTKEPFECYHISDVEAGLGLKRKHLIAISLLVGNDHDLNGVQGIGLEKALRFVQSFSEDEILNQLHEISNGNSPSLQIVSKVVDEIMLCPDESPARSKTSHCSFCGHPGSKRAHFKSSCEYCGTSTSQGCTRKAEGFKCNCSSCNKDRKEKEQQKHENWHIKVCNKISTEPNFPNDDIIQMYLCNKHGNFTAGDGLCLSWRCPETEILVDFLDFHQHWEPSYVRQRMLPMLSTIYLREMAAKPEKTMLYGQYVFDSIQRVKIRYGHQCYVIRWRKVTSTAGSIVCTNSVEEYDKPQEEIVEIDEFIDHLDEDTAPQIHVDDECCFLLTDENMELIRSAFPEDVERFWHEKELKASKRRKGSGFKNEGSSEKSESPKSKRVQLRLTEFYRSAKVAAIHTKQGDLANNSENQEDGPSKGKNKVSSTNLPKSVRRRLLFE